MTAQMTDLETRLDRIGRALNPRSVALVGASNDPQRISGRALVYLRKGGFDGPVYPVNSRRAEVQGLAAYPTIADIPDTPDVALLMLPAAAQADALRQCAAKGITAAVVFAAGFAETGEDGALLQDELAEVAHESGIALIGPNSLGILNAHTGFAGTFSSAFDGGLPVAGGVAIVSQSGAYGGHLAYLCRKRGVDIGYWVATGNEAVTDVADCIAWLATRDDVSVILAYAEGVRDADRLRAALAAAKTARKPVVFMKVGASETGAAAAASHTASLAGSDAVLDSLLRQYGVHRAVTTQEQVDVAYACSRSRALPRGRSVGIVTVSGGFGVQLSDAADRHRLDVRALPEPARARLRALNPMASDNNPCDTTANWLNDMGLITKTFDVMYHDGNYDSVIGSFTMLPDSPTFGPGIRAAINAGTSAFMDRPTILCMEARDEVVRQYEADGFLVFDDSERAARALAALCGFAEAFEKPTIDVLVGRFEAPPIGNTTPSEHTARNLLETAGIPFLPSHLAHSRDEATEIAADLGVPVAMKIVSADIAHKSDIGGVALGIESAEAGNRFDDIRARVHQAQPAARIEGVLISPMCPRGVEMIVGVTRDPVFGPVIMVGIGGVQAEVYGDVSLRVGAVDESEARRMIDELRGSVLLEGFRGTPTADRDALARLVSALSVYAVDTQETIEQIDLNPVVVLAEGQGVVALDALIVPRTAWPKIN